MTRKTLLLTSALLATASLTACGAEPANEELTPVVQEIARQVDADTDTEDGTPHVPDVLLDADEAAELDPRPATGGLDHITSCSQVARHAGTLIEGLTPTEEEFGRGEFTCTWEVTDPDSFHEIQALTVDGDARDHSPFIFGPDVLEATGLTPLPHAKVERAGGMATHLDAGTIHVVTVTVPDAEIAVSGGGWTHSRVQIEAALELAVNLLDL